MSWTDPCRNCGEHRADCDCGNWNNYKNINIMKSGIELIAQERQEQVEKHGYTKERDALYTNGELLRAADFCTNPREGVWPLNWSTMPKYRIIEKSKVGQLICAGAFYMAEQDRTGTLDYQERILEIAAEIDRLNNQ